MRTTLLVLMTVLLTSALLLFVIVVETMDAIDLMNQFRRDKTYFDVVDLDPYGTAIPFLEGAITSLA